MAINRSQLRKQLVPGLNAIFGMTYKDYPPEWKTIFAVESSKRAFEEEVLMPGFGIASVKGEGSGVQFDTSSEAWTARYVMQTIALGYAITEEAQDDNLYGSIGSKFSKALARSMNMKKEIDGANVLNNGFSSSFAGGDGKELFATDHPLVNGGTFSNERATPADLSETALEDATIAISQFVDDRNLPIRVLPKKLVIHPSNMHEATRLLYSELRTGTPDNDLNSIKYNGSIPDGFSVNHFLTDPDAWFIITDCPDGLKHFVRKSVATKTEGEFNTGNILFKATERYAFGWTDPRGAYGSSGS